MLVRKYELANHTYRSPALSSLVMEGSAVEVTVDSTAASIDVRHRAGKVAQNRQPLVVGPASAAAFSSSVLSTSGVVLCGVLGGWPSALSPACGGEVAASAMARRKECLVNGAKRLVCRRCCLWLLSSCYIYDLLVYICCAPNADQWSLTNQYLSAFQFRVEYVGRVQHFALSVPELQSDLSCRSIVVAVFTVLQHDCLRGFPYILIAVPTLRPLLVKSTVISAERIHMLQFTSCRLSPLSRRLSVLGRTPQGT